MKAGLDQNIIIYLGWFLAQFKLRNDYFLGRRNDCGLAIVLFIVDGNVELPAFISRLGGAHLNLGRLERRRWMIFESFDLQIDFDLPR